MTPADPITESESDMPQSTTNLSADKPAKPYAAFPLYPHASGRWAKRINGKMCYFGKWRGEPGDGWKAALDRYIDDRDALHAGRVPDSRREGLTVKDLCNAFLTFKKRRLESGELAVRSFCDMNETTDRIAVSTLGVFMGKSEKGSFTSTT
ncbi:MAG: hypothetical protein ACYC6N_05010 [Pirellulaceae bacterium]